MSYKFSEDQSLENARQNRTQLYMQNVCPDTVTWDESFDYLTEVMNEDSHVRLEKYFTIITHTAHHHLDKVKNFCAEIEKIENRSGDNIDAHMYTGLTSMSESIGEHHDVCEVIFWQCIGRTEWTINRNDTYVMSPGDCIYIPKGMMHEVKSLSPRMGVSFGF